MGVRAKVGAISRTTSEASPMPPGGIGDTTALELAALIRGREVSATEAAEAAIAAVETANPLLNAIIRFDPDSVRAEAKRADERRKRGDTAPLLGVPFTVKDNIWVGGRVVSQGSALFADFVAPADALAVERLRRAGGVFLGLTNCSEFACKGVTTNRLFGPTRNPWDLERTPGGSSGGAASAVAAGLGPLALCTDGGGSTRRPAALVGVVGLKPTAGLVPHPIGFQAPVFGNEAVGQMARTVADAAALLDAVAGFDPRDPMTPPQIQPPAASAALGRPLAGLRVAYSPRLGVGALVDPDVAEVVARAAEALATAGAAVERRDPAWPEGADEAALMPLQLAGLAALHGDAFRTDPSRFDPDIAAQIEQGLATPGSAVAAALLMREAMYRTLAALFADVDLLLTPTTPCTAWPLAQPGPTTIEGRPVSPRAHAVFTPFFNHTFLPACTVPCGLAANGLPVGAQLIGRRFEDASVLQAAAGIEAATGGAFCRPTRPRDGEGDEAKVSP
jgi:aspartyl-tRNA(Asn)/glutamyl-tRNA(Gln) amidotransferase subunit A